MYIIELYHKFRRVPFTPDQIVLLDGFPRRDYGAVQFRFVIVLPPDAVPMDRHLKQPLLTKEVLSGNFCHFFRLKAGNKC